MGSSLERWITGTANADELRVTMDTAADLTPDTSASVLKIAKRTGVPAHVVESDLEGFRRDTEQPDPFLVTAKAPKVAGWLAESPYHAAAARDDLEHLTALDDLFRGAGFFTNLGKGLGAGLIQLEQGLGNLLEAAGEGVAQWPTAIGMGQDVGAERPGARIGKALGGIVRRDAQENLAFYTPRVGSYSQVASGGDLRDYLAYQIGQGGGSMLAITGGFLAGGPQGAAATGGAMAFGDVREELQELAPEQAADTRNALALALAIPIAALDQITPGQIASKLLARGAATAVVREAAQYGLTRQVAGAVLKSAVAEGGTEVGQELLQYLGTRVATGTSMSASEGGMRALDAFIGGALGGGTFSGAVETPRIQQAVRAQRFFQRLGEVAGQSKLAQRLPEAMEQVVERLTANGPVETIYADVTQWTAYFQGVGLDPAQVADEVIGEGGRAWYEEAVATGGRLAIPTSRYAITLAPSEHHAALTPDLAFAPDELTAREADRVAEQIMAAEGETTTTEPDGPTVEDVLTERLTATGRYRAEDAGLLAQQMGAFLRTVGTRTGQDPMALLERFGLTIGDGQQQEDEAAMAAQEQGPLEGEFWQSYITTLSPEESAALRAQLEGTGFASEQGQATVIVPPGQRIMDGDDTVSVMARAVRMVGRERFQQLAKAEIAQRGGSPDLDVQKAAIEQTARRITASPQEFFQPAYHGSPHIFDKFSLHAIGTGEGAQAYGWGLYFAGKKEIAEFYRDQLSPPPEVTTFRIGSVEMYRNGQPTNYSPREQTDNAIARALVAEALHTRHADVTSAWEKGGVEAVRSLVAQELDEMIETYTEEHPPYVPILKVLRKRVDEKGGLVFDAKKVGRLYKVEIPEDDTMLLWDKPLSEQPEAVKQAFAASAERIEDKFVARIFAKAAGPKADNFWQNGSEFYRSLVSAYAQEAPLHLSVESAENSAQQRASEAMASLGINGIKYLDGTSRNAGEGSYNYVIFDDQLVQITEYEQAAFNGPRGRIRIDERTRQMAIDLFESADFSTFLHESAHFYLEVLRDLSGEHEALAQDAQAILAFLGVQQFSDIRREHHETFARAMEAYFMEGKAPSIPLRRAFYRFKLWLQTLYRSVATLDVTLTREIRDVFDRLFAAEAEIDAAENEAAVVPIFTTAEDAGMSDEAFAAYRADIEQAHQTAVEKVTVTLMREAQREQAVWWQEQKAQITEQVTAEVDEQPVYRALRVLQKGITNPDGTVTTLKLDKQDLLQRKDKDFLKALPRPYVYAKTGGANADLVAETLGFSSGDDLLTALVNAPPRAQVIEAEVERRLTERHGDMRVDGSIADEAEQAVMGEHRDAIIRAELRALHAKARTVKPHLDAAKREAKAQQTEGRQILAGIPTAEQTTRIAQARIAMLRVRDIKPYPYWVAARKARKAALDAVGKQDPVTAANALQAELLNLALYREAQRALAEYAALDREARAVFKSDEKLSRTRDMAFVNAARSLAAAWGFAPGTQLEGEDFLAQVKRYDPDSYDTVTAMLRGAMPPAGPVTHPKQITAAQMVELRETLKAVWYLARRTRQIEIDGQKMDRDEVRAELTARVDMMGVPHARLGYDKAVTDQEKVGLALMGARAALRRVEHWVDAMDSNDPSGVFRRYVWTPISEAVAAFRVQKRDVLARYLDMVKPLEAGLTKQPIAANEIRYTFRDKAELLGALLHTGNSSNFQKLLRGRAWDADAWGRFHARMVRDGILTKADYDYLQGVWDLFEELKGGAQQAHRDLYGRYFSEITAEPILTPWGEYRGGYVPARTDSLVVNEAAVREEKAAMEQGGNSFMFPSTGKGFTKSRVEQYAAPLLMDVRLVPAHIDAVLRFTHIQPRVVDLGRILWNRDFQQTMNGFDPAVISDMILPWLQRTATQQVSVPSKGRAGRAVDTFARALRSRAGLNVMVANVVNTLQQFTGLSVAAQKVPIRALRSALWRYIRNPKGIGEDIAAKSAFMQTRTTAQVMEIQNHLDDLLLNPTKYEQARDFAAKHGYFMQGGTQNIVDTIVWAGAYDHAVEQGASDKEAVRQADSAVRLTQGSFAAEDIARFEVGTPFERLFTMFSGYFNMLANLMGTEVAVVARDIGLRKGAGRLFYAYLFVFMIPAVLSEILVRMGAGEPWDEDDDGYMDDFLALFFGAQARTATALFPFVGPMVSAGLNAWNKKPYDDRLSTSPVVSNIESTVRAPNSVYKAIAEDGDRSRAVRDALTAVSLLTGVPVTPLGRPLGYLLDVQEGDADPTGPADFTRGLITGRPGRQ